MMLSRRKPYFDSVWARNWITNWTLVILKLWSWNMTWEYHEIYHFWWFSDCLGGQDALFHPPSDWLSASFPTEQRTLLQWSLHLSCSTVSISMCFFLTTAENHVEIAAGTKCSTSPHGIKTIFKRIWLRLPCIQRETEYLVEDFSKVMCNFLKAPQYLNILHIAHRSLWRELVTY